MGKTYARLDDSDFLNDATAFSVAGWFNIHDYDTWNKLFSKTLTNSNRTAVELADGKIYFEVARSTNSYGVTAAGAIPAEGWHHLAFVYDGNGRDNAERLKIYIDGEEMPLSYTGTIPEKTTNVPFPFTFGQVSANPDMAFTEVSVWNRPLSRAEVQAYRQMRLSGTEEGLVYYLKTEEKEGSVLENSCRNDNYTAMVVNMLSDTRYTDYLSLMLYGCIGEMWRVSDVATFWDTPRRQGGLTVMPNPNDGNFRVSMVLPGTGVIRVSVYNIYGNLLYREEIPGGAALNKTLSLSHLSPGSYILEVARGEYYRQKLFVKQ